jgi:prevent-host-death family protein
MADMPSRKISASEAKTHWSVLLQQVARGRTFVITRHGRPVAELRPSAPVARPLRFGCDRGAIIVHDDFEAPVPGMGKYEASS